MIAPQTEEERVERLTTYLFLMYGAEADEIEPVARFWRNEAESLGWTE